MSWLPAVMAVGGLLLLAFSADRFVLAAARLSKLWGLSPILIGALIVGMGTSSPELLVSGLAAAAGEPDLAFGNAVGSNVANVTLVLGGTAILAPLSGNLKVLKREGVLMLIAVTILAAVLFDLNVSRVEGIAMLVGMVVAALLVIRWAKIDQREVMKTESLDEEEDEDKPSAAREITLGALALGATLLGAEMLVKGGIDLAQSLGIGSAFIGMTLVAVGTSLPELATSIAGIRRNEHDLVLGNVLGSNLFNALAVGGVAGTLSPSATDPSFRFAAIAMVICAALAGFLAFTGRQLVRWEGIILVLGFVAFVYFSY